MGRFIQESAPIPPSQACVVNKREVGENGDKIRGVWEGRGQGRCRGREAGICLPGKVGGKPSLGEAWMEPAVLWRGGKNWSWWGWRAPAGRGSHCAILGECWGKADVQLSVRGGEPGIKHCHQ